MAADPPLDGLLAAGTSVTADPADHTFTTYNTTQSSAYSASRSTYPSALIAEVLTYHTTTTPHPSDNILLDVGCGPGTATRSLAPFFHHVFATDPSSAMISAATSLPSTTISNTPISFSLNTAESLLSTANLQPGTIDLITAATSAHWFNLPKFYTNAATLLKSGGTLAFWTSSSLYCHPDTTPNACTVQSILFDLERHILSPFETPGNRLSRDMYDTLPLPWTVSPRVTAFPEAQFIRKEWNRDGKVAPGESFFRSSRKQPLEVLARSLGTASMVTRWRAANALALENGEVEDCVSSTMRQIKEAMGGEEELEAGSATVLLMFKKAL